MDEKEKQIVFNTVKATVELMSNNYSFRKYLENLGLDRSDYEDLYKAGGMAMREVYSLRTEAYDEHRLLSKKDIFVEEVELEFGKILIKA